MGVLDHLCRYCSKELDRSASKDIFTPENSCLLKTTFLCLSEKLQANERYPKMACLDCVFKIKVVTEFQEMGLSAFKVFDDILSREDNKASEAQENGSVEIKAEILSDVEFEEEDVKYSVTGEPNDRSLNSGEDNSNIDELPPLIKKRKQHFATRGQVHTGDKPYRCELCDKKYKRSSYLSRHQRVHTGEGLHHCPVCQKTFSVKSKFTKHMLVHTRVERFQCEHCEKYFASKSSLVGHIRMHTGEQPYQCQECKTRFRKLAYLRRHMLCHSSARPFQCEHCVKTYKCQSHLTKHLKLHTGEKPYRCELCDKSFTERCDLKRHKRVHTGEKLHQCPVCQKTFSAKSNFTRHMRSHTGVKRYQCAHCEKCFAEKLTLVQHIRLHTGEKPYQCQECNKCFRGLAYLRWHMLCHSSARPFQCGHCDKAFKCKSHLTQHQKLHTCAKPYRCELCDESFTERRLLTRHERMHSDETPFQCEHCTEAFHRKSSLVIHLRLHKGDKPFECTEGKLYEMSQEFGLIPPEGRSVAEATAADLLPAKSAKKYMECYKMYKDWEIAKRIFFPSEDVLLAYFGHLTDTKRLKSSSLWTIYSMLRTTLLNNDKVDISKYQKLRALLKKQNVGYSPKKSKVLSSSEIWKFIKEAPDDEHLLSKAIALFGVAGALRQCEIHQITLEDVEEKEGALFVTIPGTRGNKPKTFAITNELFNVYKKYRQLRRDNVKTRKLFLNYQKGKCTSQAVGINKIGGIPKAIAQYLKLPDAYLYTGHCFRRSAAHFSWTDALNGAI